MQSEADFLRRIDFTSKLRLKSLVLRTQTHHVERTPWRLGGRPCRDRWGQLFLSEALCPPLPAPFSVNVRPMRQENDSGYVL